MILILRWRVGARLSAKYFLKAVALQTAAQPSKKRVQPIPEIVIREKQICFDRIFPHAGAEGFGSTPCLRTLRLPRQAPDCSADQRRRQSFLRPQFRRRRRHARQSPDDRQRSLPVAPRQNLLPPETIKRDSAKRNS